MGDTFQAHKTRERAKMQSTTHLSLAYSSLYSAHEWQYMVHTPNGTKWIAIPISYYFCFWWKQIIVSSPLTTFGSTKWWCFLLIWPVVVISRTEQSVTTKNLAIHSPTREPLTRNDDLLLCFGSQEWACPDKQQQESSHLFWWWCLHKRRMRTIYLVTPKHCRLRVSRHHPSHWNVLQQQQ